MKNKINKIRKNKYVDKITLTFEMFSNDKVDPTKTFFKPIFSYA